jgi:hypothetical protein
MKRLPLLMDDHPSALVRAGVYVLVPIALLLLLPFLLLMILALYLSALFHGMRVVVMVFTARQQEAEVEIRTPHFLELPASAKVLPDESSLPPKG